MSTAPVQVQSPSKHVSLVGDVLDLNHDPRFLEGAPVREQRALAGPPPSWSWADAHCTGTGLPTVSLLVTFPPILSSVLSCAQHLLILNLA